MMYAGLTGMTFHRRQWRGRKNCQNRRIKSHRGNINARFWRSGKEKMIDLLESRIGNAERTMQNNMSNDAYSTGTADGGKQIGGLQLLVGDVNNSGSVGGRL